MIFFLKFGKMSKDSSSALRMHFGVFTCQKNMENPQVPLNVKIRKMCEIHQNVGIFQNPQILIFFSFFQKKTQKSLFFIISPENMAPFFFLDSELESKSWDKMTKSEKSESVKFFKLLVFINTFRLRIWFLERVSDREWDKRKFSLNFFPSRKKEML